MTWPTGGHAGPRRACGRRERVSGRRHESTGRRVPVETTELRVPGVGGSSPEGILDRPIVTRVAGDRNAGFYRPTAGHGEPRGPGGLIEAYGWGDLTGGRTTRILSLVLLLPFMLSNIAIWMLPPASAGSVAVARAICRLLAATLTAMYVLAVVGVAVDLVAWQCAGYQHCAAERRTISWLAGLQPGQRIALSALVPIAAVALIRWLGARSWRLPEDAAATEVPGGCGALRLDDHDFWDNRALLRRLRALHGTVALGIIDVVLLGAVAPHDNGSAGYGLLGLAAIVLLAAAALLCRPARPGHPRDRLLGAAVQAVHGVMLVLTALTVGYAALPRSRWTPATELPGYDSLVASLYVSQAALMLLLAAVVLWQRGRTRTPAYLDGLGAPVAAAFAVGLGVAYSSAVLYAASYYLDRNLNPTPRRLLPGNVPPLLPPVAYRWAAMGFFVALLATGLAAVLRGRLTLGRRHRAAMEILRRDFPDAPAEQQPRVRAVREAIARAKLTEWSWPLPAAYAVIFVLILGSAGLSLASIGPRDLGLRIGGESLARSAVFLSHLGTNLTVLFAAAMAFAGVSHRSKAVRIVGVVWELATFWPRTTHPLAPPCYTERVVPELTRRVRYLTRHHGAVVLSGHSHGALLVAAAVLQLEPACLDRVALLTSANPLRRLYSMVFPAYLGPATLRDIGDRLGWRWRNLWRDTDPVGGWVFSPAPAPAPAPAAMGGPTGADPAAGVDLRLRDPCGLLTPSADTVPPVVRGHGFDPNEAEYRRAVADLVARLHRR
ncbi:hypothetical protein Q2K19_28250 [Micromonospora soli]|uniref:hypothetical protein n=1 Tax=Micromonospora sp. NBRC 110009 TaxID=3061627 RepID=UPI00267401ED|nr:hypothetical protein [Micromonospora sp. NBRC 110009]WKT98019.1 hypothetical protein Q2K19_28250 [Micromonospora sp. NBRC 110009]